MNITQALARFLTQLEADGRSQLTIGQYRRHVQLLATWAKHEGLSGDLLTFSSDVLARFLCSAEACKGPTGRPKKASSVNVLRASIKGLFGYLHLAGIIRSDPSRLIRRARCGAPPPRGLSEAEQERLMGVLEQGEGVKAERDHVLFGLMLFAGLRIGAALSLDATDVNLERCELRVRITKGDQPRTVLIGPRAVQVLGPHMEQYPIGPLFRGANGDALTARHAQRRFKLWAERAEIREVASTHSLRHSFAMGLYQRTGDLGIVQRALGHRSIASTLVYAQADDERLRDALTH